MNESSKVWVKDEWWLTLEQETWSEDKNPDAHKMCQACSSLLHSLYHCPGRWELHAEAKGLHQLGNLLGIDTQVPAVPGTSLPSLGFTTQVGTVLGSSWPGLLTL